MPPATVTAARDVPDEHPARAEAVAVWALRRGQGDPPAATVLDEITDTDHHSSVEG